MRCYIYIDTWGPPLSSRELPGHFAAHIGSQSDLWRTQQFSDNLAHARDFFARARDRAIFSS